MLTTNKFKYIAVFLAYSALAGLAYAPGISNTFVFDDVSQILANPWLHTFSSLPIIFTSGVWDFLDFPPYGGIYYRPLMHVGFLVEYSLFGLNPVGYHVVSILLHALNATLLYGLVWRLSQAASPHTGSHEKLARYFWGAFFTGSVFLLHPVASETVYWIATLPELLCAFFYLLTVHCFLTAETKWQHYGSVSVLFLLALLSKEIAVTIPAFLFVLTVLLLSPATDRFTFRFRRGWNATWHLWLLLGVYVGWRAWVLSPPGSLSPTENVDWGQWLLINLHTVVELSLENIQTLLHLRPLSIFHPYTPSFPEFYTALTLFLIGAAAWAGYRVIRQRLALHPLAVTGMLFLLLPLLPALNFIQLDYFVLSERYLYLPSLGWAILLVLGVDSVLKRHPEKQWLKILIGLGSVIWYISVILIVQQRAEDWRDTPSLFQKAMGTYPHLPTPPVFLAFSECEIGRVESCQQYFQRFCELYRAGDPDISQEMCLENPYFLLVLGRAMLASQQWSEAERMFDKLIQVKPLAVEAWWGRGEVRFQQGRVMGARDDWQQALSLAPDHPRILKSLSHLPAERTEATPP